MYDKEFILNEVNTIRREIGHDAVDIFIEELYFNEKIGRLYKTPPFPKTCNVHIIYIDIIFNKSTE